MVKELPRTLLGLEFLERACDCTIKEEAGQFLHIALSLVEGDKILVTDNLFWLIIPLVPNYLDKFAKFVHQAYFHLRNAP